MKFCQPHWDQLAAAIEARGLSSLIADSGEEAAKSLMSELEVGRTLDNFDPLMGAHNAISANAMQIAKSVGGNPFVMFAADPDHPEWECPICFLNWLSAEHDRLCADPTCDKERALSFEWMIDRAADDQVEAWKAMRP